MIDRGQAAVDALHWAAAEAGLRGVGPLSDWVQRHVLQAATPLTAFPARRLLEITERRHGLLVIGRHRRNGLSNGSVARTVTSQTRVPVVVVSHRPSDKSTLTDNQVRDLPAVSLEHP